MENEKRRLIDADALTKAHCEGCAADIQEMCKTDPVCASMMWVVEAPTVDAVEVVHGRWIHPKGYVVSNGFLCSVCGHEETSYHPINPRPGGACIADENGNFYYPPKMNYCPNCGAKMDGERRKEN